MLATSHASLLPSAQNTVVGTPAQSVFPAQYSAHPGQCSFRVNRICTLRFEMMGNQTEGDMQESLPSELTFHVYAKCFCEITWPMTGRPNLMNLYVRDNGVAYEFSAGYQYYQEVE